MIKALVMSKVQLSFLICILILPFTINSQVVPHELRGQVDAEREGQHDANKIRTLFYNFGMVGDYPDDPLNVDYSVFHSVEVPKGSGENYSDGITPFVLARVIQNNGNPAYIMETGYRERQGTSPLYNRIMRFEPRPGYFQEDPLINQGRSIAMSNDPRTWPDQWIDKLDDIDDPGWSGSWNGYFGKAPAADQESFVVFDDDFYDAWDYYPDSRDNTRRGLGLRIEQRGFQWANPQAGNVIFWHYDITNESTTTYDDNIIFGLYMDSGVGGSAIGLDGVPESDDDNAYWDKDAGINLVYTWDKNGNGSQGPTGYLGYSYMETPGNGTDGIDNDDNGITDELRDGGPGTQIIGQQAIMDYVTANYDPVQFEEFFGDITKRPAYRAGVWWTGDEDMDWVAEFNDTGADGIFADDENPTDTGELDGIPTAGEPNFDKTDVDESDQIGLTGFKMNRIRAGAGSPTTNVDNIVFFDDGKEWPRRLYDFFISDTSFDDPLVLNYNIGFLFASGPFKLEAGKTERFSLALAFGKNLRELTNTTKVVQQIYKANYQFAVPPPMPHVKAFTGDGFVTLTWDDRAERAFDPVTNTNDFQGYRVYRSTDPSFLDPQIIYTGTGTSPIGNGKPIAQFDLDDDIQGFSQITVEGVAYFLGENTGLKHTYKDSTVTNGQTYYYAVTAYDEGSDSLVIYPSENSITVSQTLRSGTILPINVVEVRPNAPVAGYTEATFDSIQHSSGTGDGTIEISILNSELVPDEHNYEIQFTGSADSVHARNYSLINTTTSDTLYTTGTDFEGLGEGPVGDGILAIISTAEIIEIDSANSGFIAGSPTDAKLKVRYAPALPITYKRPGFPDNLEIIFSDSYLDTSLAAIGKPAKPAKFKIIAKSKDGDQQLNFRFLDDDNDGTLSGMDESIEIVTYAPSAPAAARATWNVSLDTIGLGGLPGLLPAGDDVYNLKLKLPFGTEDVFAFKTFGQKIDNSKAKEEFSKDPYVVPNPYVGAASFEPQRFAVSGRGERRMEFRNLPQNCVIKIFTINGELVKTLVHNGSMNEGFIPWDLRSSDNLEVAPGLYIFHVDSKEVGSYIGKFAIVK